MKKIFPIFLLVIHSTISYAAQIQADVTKTRQLENALLCEKPLSPKKIYNLVSELNGTNPQNRSDSFRGIYTVPFGFYILDQQVTEFNITRFLAEDERYTYRYSTPLPNLSPSEVAALLEIKQNDETKQYDRGNLRIRVENGRTVLTCLFR